MRTNRVIPHEISVIDNKIRYTLNAARRNTEGFRTNMQILKKNSKNCLL